MDPKKLVQLISDVETKVAELRALLLEISGEAKSEAKVDEDNS